jgi:hypothetical protein
MAEKKAFDPSKLRAFKVYAGNEYIGAIGEGEGPFVSMMNSALPNPWLDHVRFTSFSISEEKPISFIITENLDFDTVISVMTKRKYRLEAVPYRTVFLPPDESPRWGPDGDTWPLDI